MSTPQDKTTTGIARLEEVEEEVRKNPPPPEPAPISPVDRRNQLLNSQGEWEDRKIIN